jgi:hypothetical protein
LETLSKKSVAVFQAQDVGDKIVKIATLDYDVWHRLVRRSQRSREWGFVISYLIFMSTFAIIGSPRPTIPNFLLQLAALGLFFMAVRRLSILVLTIHRLENFEEYEEELEAEFPGMVNLENLPARASPVPSAQ